MSNARARASGTVKWFNCTRGFGYITPSDGSEDVFVHQSALTMDGFRSCWEGDEVEFEVEEVEGRMKAANVTGPGGAPLKHTPTSKYRRVRKQGSAPDGENGKVKEDV
ncbi:Cold-shock protein, DNA-binding [Ostreococcus tauri]|uniref:Cold-shock protein, DNA-binding n=1 Tax=Ostreococcus tauri TaxID=70448 RepID=A0A090M754_OSTTA|nr:Cold-shock protein, DNA-binding [Ostreococcus tauri]CEF97904.1 Cold-shock protein, DNA-binding [Ostreococcus tauri]|eukprot:XP_022838956.1 Cold-shock protein, DNA-binding [Ostreococcus tauri]